MRETLDAYFSAVNEDRYDDVAALFAPAATLTAPGIDPLAPPEIAPYLHRAGCTRSQHDRHWIFAVRKTAECTVFQASAALLRADREFHGVEDGRDQTWCFSEGVRATNRSIAESRAELGFGRRSTDPDLFDACEPHDQRG